MLPYLLATGIVAVLALAEPRQKVSTGLWSGIFVILLVFVGLRHHVGMDWNNYLIMIERANRGSFLDALEVAEPGYVALLRIAGRSGTGVYGAYFLGTLIFLAGLFRFSRTTREPWLALLVAMPYLVIVIGMSAARQAVAIGVLLWLMADWNEAGVIKRLTFIALASSFHTSALIFCVFAATDLKSTPPVRVLAQIVAALVAYYGLEASGRQEYYADLYIRQRDQFTEAGGALFHVALNAAPALYALIGNREKRRFLLVNSVSVQMAIASIAAFVLAFLASGAASRISLYLFPVSMRVFSGMPGRSRTIRTAAQVRGLLAALFILECAAWLAFAHNASAHRHYQNVLFVLQRERILCCH